MAGQADVTQRTESGASPGGEPSPSPVRTYLLNCGSSSLADRTFSFLMLLCALSIFAIVLLILIDFLKWMLQHQNEVTALYYAPLPAPVAQKVSATINTLK